MGKKVKPTPDPGLPKSRWYIYPEWQITTWLTGLEGWVVRIDGPADVTKELDGLSSRDESEHVGELLIREAITPQQDP